MNKLIRNVEMGVMLLIALLSIVSIIGGLFQGAWHCVCLGAMIIFIPYVWYVEDYQKKGKSLWQKKNSKN